MYKNSFVAHSLIIEMHQQSASSKQFIIETGWGYVLKSAYIFFRSDLVKKNKARGEKCRHLIKCFDGRTCLL